MEVMLLLDGLQTLPVACQPARSVSSDLVYQSRDAVPIAAHYELAPRRQQLAKTAQEEASLLAGLTGRVSVDESALHALKRKVQALQTPLHVGLRVGNVSDGDAGPE
jgi:hypothetical protein